METNSDEKIVKRGTFLYGGVRQCAIKIIETSFRPGTGDYEDPPEIRDDAEGVFFEVWYESAGTREFSSGSVGFDSVVAAMKHVEAIAADVRWE